MRKDETLVKRNFLDSTIYHALDDRKSVTFPKKNVREKREIEKGIWVDKKFFTNNGQIILLNLNRFYGK